MQKLLGNVIKHINLICRYILRNVIMKQWSPTFLAPGTVLWKTIFSCTQLGAGGRGMVSV